MAEQSGGAFTGTESHFVHAFLFYLYLPIVTYTTFQLLGSSSRGLESMTSLFLSEDVIQSTPSTSAITESDTNIISAISRCKFSTETGLSSKPTNLCPSHHARLFHTSSWHHVVFSNKIHCGALHLMILFLT